MVSISCQECCSQARGPLAHPVEQGTFNPKVRGSRPRRPTDYCWGNGLAARNGAGHVEREGIRLLCMGAARSLVPGQYVQGHVVRACALTVHHAQGVGLLSG
jgi:hypothetical protein